jgi:hypothetical protein
MTRSAAGRPMAEADTTKRERKTSRAIARTRAVLRTKHLPLVLLGGWG